MSWLLADIRKMLLAKNFSGAAGVVAWSIRERVLDRRFGINTRKIITPQELGTDTSTSENYEPTSYRVLQLAMSHVAPRSSAKNSVLLDVGSGMGRSSLVAATYPFSAIIGIEYSADLVKTARDNLRKALPRLKCKDVGFVAVDAGRYDIPDTVTTIFMSNPFRGVTLDRFMTKVRETMERKPREIDIAFIGFRTLDGVRYPWVKTYAEYDCKEPAFILKIFLSRVVLSEAAVR